MAIRASGNIAAINNLISKLYPFREELLLFLTVNLDKKDASKYFDCLYLRFDAFRK